MGIKRSPTKLISSGLDIISPLFENIVLGFDGYKDRELFCNRQIKTQLFFASRKNYHSSLVSTSRLSTNFSRLVESSSKTLSQRGFPFLKKYLYPAFLFAPSMPISFQVLRKRIYKKPKIVVIHSFAKRVVTEIA